MCNNILSAPLSKKKTYLHSHFIVLNSFLSLIMTFSERNIFFFWIFFFCFHSSIFTTIFSMLCSRCLKLHLKLFLKILKYWQCFVCLFVCLFATAHVWYVCLSNYLIKHPVFVYSFQGFVEYLSCFATIFLETLA